MRAARAHPWLVFVHQLPARPSHARVRIWRRLQQIGAAKVKHAVHVLPNTAQSLEDFEWLKSEVTAVGGQATIFAASTVKGVDERKLRSQVRASRSARAADRTRRSIGSPTRPGPGPSTEPPPDLREFQGRQWITRPRPGVDRFSSAWLIRRFVDARAKFVFGSSPDRAPEAVPFDMYQPGGFRHEADRCTFEVLQARFAIVDAAVTQIGEIVHDLDLKEARFGSAHAVTMGLLVEGLRASFSDDAQLLEQGIALFEALYQSLRPAKSAKSGRPGIC